VSKEAEVDLKGLEQPVETLSTLRIPFSENIGTIYAQIQCSSAIVLKSWKASYADFSEIF